jgi:hypothetical protein
MLFRKCQELAGLNPTGGIAAGLGHMADDPQKVVQRPGVLSPEVIAPGMLLTMD